MSDKTLDNTTANQAKDQIPDLKIWGDGDMWKLICKASSEREDWMKSTKAMEVQGGVIVQVTTQQDKHVAESLCFVHGVKIEEEILGGKVVGRRLVPLYDGSDDQLVDDDDKRSQIENIKPE